MTPNFDNPEACFLCRRRADGLGVHKGNRVGWLCQQCNDGGYGMKAIMMRARAFDEYETRALQAAGNAAGNYLTQIGETDLSKLHPANWGVFCEILVVSFGDAIREEVGVGALRPSLPEPPLADEISEDIEDITAVEVL